MHNNQLIGTNENAIGFAGQSVFLTGGSRGIGSTIREHFLALGAEVTAPGREELDLSSRDSISGYVSRQGMDEYDVFVHCAGFNELGGITELDITALERCFQINLFSAVELLRHITPGMIRRKKGHIVMISSLYAIVSRERRVAYSASKNALTGLVKTLTLELAPDGIMVNAVAPGYVMTDMTRKNVPEEEIKKIEAKIPAGCFQSKEDISNLVVFLASDFNQNITGQLIAVDGGFLCR